MSAPKHVDGKAKMRDRSEDRDVFIRVPTTLPPPAREIPLPEFYPRERTSTASFKAPVTAAGRKKMEATQPPPAGTLTTAIGYISSPVRYISSIFSGSQTQPLEPPKPKERVFKIDLEKEREKQVSPKLVLPIKKPPAIIFEEPIPVTKAQQQVWKGQSSSWRRRNGMDYGSSRPTSPTPASSLRGQKRPTPSTSPPPELSSPKFNQLMISSSLNQSSYKVMSKFPVEEAEKKSKKDLRKGTNVSAQKESPTRTNFNRPNSKNYPASPTKLNSISPGKEYPICPFPTMLPPRVPPPSYSIKSNNTPSSKKQEEDVQESEIPGENEPDDCVSNTLSAPKDTPELVSYPSPIASVDDENEFELQETLGKAGINETAKVSRLDQLPHGRLSNATSIKNLFHDAKLVHDSHNEAAFSNVVPAGRIGTMDVVLCSTTIKHSWPTTVKHPSPTKMSQSPSRPIVNKRSSNPSVSPVRQPAAPAVMRSISRKAQEARLSGSLNNETGFKSQARPIPQAGVQIKSNQSKEIVPKSLKSSSSNQAAKDLQRKPSPLRVEDKHVPTVEESIGKSLNQRRSRQSMWSKSPAREITAQRSNPAPGVYVKPNVKTVMKSPARPQQSGAKKESANTETATAAVQSSATTAAATAAATVAASAAAAALASILQPAIEKEITAKEPEPPIQAEQPPKQEQETKPRSPPSLRKMSTERAAALGIPSPRSSAQKKEEQAAPLETQDSATNPDVKPKRSLSGETKGFLKNKFHNMMTAKHPQLSADNIIEIQDVSAKQVPVEDNEEPSCLDNYCGDPAKFCQAATMMGEIP